MTSWCVIMFEDESLGRVSPIEYVKLDNNRKFKPKSAKDLPDDKAFVKWQKSVDSGSFLSDGYFPAQILAIAGSVKSALAKAVEMKVKMHPSPVLALPVASTASTESSSSKRKRPKDLSSESSKASKRNESGSVKDKVLPSAKVSSSSKRSKHSKESVKKSQDCSVPEDFAKSKAKKLKLDDVAISRVQNQLALAVTDNPLVKAADNSVPDDSNCVSPEPKHVPSSQSKSSGSSDEGESESMSNDSKKSYQKNQSDSGNHFKLDPLSTLNNEDSKECDVELNSEETSVHHDGPTRKKLKSLKDVSKESGNASASTPNKSGNEKINDISSQIVQSKPNVKDALQPKDRISSPAKMSSSAKQSKHGKKLDKKSKDRNAREDNGKSKSKKLKLDDVEVSCVKNQLALAAADNSVPDDSFIMFDNDELKPIEMKPQASNCVSPEPKHVPSSQSKSSGSSDEGESKSMSKNPKKSVHENQSEDLNNFKLDTVSTLNSKARVESNNEKPSDGPTSNSDEEGNDLDDTIPVNLLVSKEITSGSSSERSSSESDSGSEDEVAKLLVVKQKLESDLKKIKLEFEENKRNLTLVNNLRIAHKDEISSLKRKLDDKMKQIGTLQKRNGTLQDMLCKANSGSKSTKKLDQDSTPKKQSNNNFRGIDSSDDSTTKETKFKDSCNDSFTEDLKPDNSLFASPPSKTSKDKKKKGSSPFENSEIDYVCDKVLRHLKKEEKLPEDSNGFVNIGHNIKIDRQAMEKTLTDHKGDVQKISKNMAALTWTTAQRGERSLEGGKNNRFPNAPSKKAATPLKVNACLGVVKAHLLNEGERNGPGLIQNLKLGRKAIGAKFAQDYNLAKRRKD